MAALSDRSRLPCALATSVALAGALALGATTAARTEALTPREQALHALNRLGFGPRPGDVERVERMGVPAYVELQLHPERIADTRVEARVAALPTLGLSSAELYARFEAPVREARKRLKAEKADAVPDGNGGDDERRRLGAMIPPENRPRRILEDLTAARVVRAAESERQLNEVLVDFWMNHFNVYANKGLDRILVATFERDTIRPRVFGRFEDLLLATAQSPAMLFYLDNARSVADEEHRPAVFARAGRFGRATSAAGKAPKGLNENYARELMELHTLGVDGGYTQTDVTELARVLTGWSIAGPRESDPGRFVFRARLHDAGQKVVLGQRFASGGGMEEGEQAIRMLARRPETARHVAFQLCQRLVADAPPPALVARVAERFLATRGDLRETVRAIVTSPEFFAPEYYRAKVKSPFEYAVSAIRAVGATTDGRAVSKQIAEMGEPLYLCQPPTGYADTAEAWVNAGALLARVNFAVALTEGRVVGTLPDPNVVGTQANAALDLGGPEFQRQ
jgi:uncharacterized protein (DUF1800 family)